MIWKILFYLLIILLIILTIVQYPTQSQRFMGINEIQSTLNIILGWGVYFILGCFWALGWKKKIYSIKATNNLLIFTTISLIITSTIYICNAYKFLIAKPYNISQITIIIFIVGAYLLLLNLVLYLPSFIALFKYKKKSEQFEDIKKPYWKIFGMSMLLAIIIQTFELLLFHSNNILHVYNIWDKTTMLSTIYAVLFIGGFAFDKRIFTQFFWKVTAIPYLIFSLINIFGCSSTYKHDITFDILMSNWARIIIYLIYCILFYTMLYKYAFTEKLWITENKEIIEKEQE